jgi:hypothetical protein
MQISRLLRFPAARCAMAPLPAPSPSIRQCSPNSLPRAVSDLSSTIGITSVPLFHLKLWPPPSCPPPVSLTSPVLTAVFCLIVPACDPSHSVLTGSQLYLWPHRGPRSVNAPNCTGAVTYHSHDHASRYAGSFFRHLYVTISNTVPCSLHSLTIAGSFHHQ